MKGLTYLYNINLSTIHKDRNSKELCLFENAASSGPFFCTILYNMPFLNHSALTMTAAGPTPRDFTSSRVKRWLFGKTMTSFRDGQWFGSTSPRGWASKEQPDEVIWMDAIF